MKDCRCGLDKVFFICKDETCPNFKFFPLFCGICAQIEPRFHNHAFNFIVTQVDLSKFRWRDLRGEVAKLKVIADEYHAIHGKLITILSEGPNNSKRLIEDYDSIIKLKADLDQFY